jgi:hypothetical protein
MSHSASSREPQQFCSRRCGHRDLGDSGTPSRNDPRSDAGGQRTLLAPRGLLCAAAFACTDYKVQGRTLDRVALELRGIRTVNIDGLVVPTQRDAYSLYIQLSRCPSLDGITLLSKARERFCWQGAG